MECDRLARRWAMMERQRVDIYMYSGLIVLELGVGQGLVSDNRASFQFGSAGFGSVSFVFWVGNMKSPWFVESDERVSFLNSFW